MIAIRHAWLQKHPSPATDGGEFHWYPRDGDRELRAGCVDRVRGLEPPAVAWELAPGRVAWARSFAAIAPSDGRRYVGLVLTIAERVGSRPAELLAALATPPAAPWAEVHDVVAARGERSFAGDPSGVARALVSGGVARVCDPIDGELPGWIAAFERCMPSAVATTVRRGAWVAGGRSAQPADRVADIAAAAWSDPGSRVARAWRLLGELGEARGQSVDEVADELSAIDDAARSALGDEERAALPGTRRLVDVLHGWGRGRLDRCATIATLTTRLADAVALRILARWVDGLDAGPAIAEARWYAVLPSDRRVTLLDAVAGRAESLRRLLEIGHA